MQCRHIPTVDYREFSDRLHKRCQGKRIPLEGAFEVTYRCNLKCRHCYCPAPEPAKELNFSQIRRIIDEICEAGCLWLLFSGGEPLLREDFLDIYSYAKRKGLLITIFTNGTLISREIADYLSKYPPFRIEVTLNGITADVYEKVSLAKGSFNLCMQGIELLKQRKLPLGLKMTVSLLNYHQLEEAKKYAKTLSAQFRFDAVLQPRLDRSRFPCDLRISAQHFVNLDMSDPDRLRGWREFCAKFFNITPSRDIFSCQAGEFSFHIDPYGRLLACGMLSGLGFDLTKSSFAHGWQFLAGLRAGKYQSYNSCIDCSIRQLCEQCPGWSWLENSSLNKPKIDYLCSIARERAKALGLTKEACDEKVLSETPG